jgi:hypothetical protein
MLEALASDYVDHMDMKEVLEIAHEFVLDNLSKLSTYQIELRYERMVGEYKDENV